MPRVPRKTVPVLTPVQMSAVDRQAIAAGTSQEDLVQRAGRAVAWHARTMLGGIYGRRVVVVSGKGNNGNDGRVAARVLRSWGVHVDRFDIDLAIDADALHFALARCDLAIDAMFGTGFRGELSGAAQCVDAELYLAPKILAVDIPSGVDGATGEIRGDGFISGAVLADETITFAAMKPGLLFEPGRFHAGRVTIADIGIDVGHSTVVQWTAADAAQARLERWPHEHKWSAAVMVVGGSRGMTGAPMLAARAAHRCGAGMVVAAMPGTAAVAESGTEIVTQSLRATFDDGLHEDAVDEILGALTRFHALVVGPGLGRSEAAARLVRALVASAPLPLIIDADAFRAFDIGDRQLAERAAGGLGPTIITPHDGEYGALVGSPVGSDRVGAARELALRTGAIVLLKGPGTTVAAPNGAVAIVANGGSELATAGTGDVLSGVIAALVARALTEDLDELFALVASAAWIHSDAAARTEMGPSMIASDLIECLPASINVLRRGG